MVFKTFDLKLLGMRKEQSFLLYPYDGGDTVLLQSDTRIMRLNIKTGTGALSKAHANGSYFHDLYDMRGAYEVTIPDDVKIKIQEYLWSNAGLQKEGGHGVLMIENKELFSEKI